MAAFTLGLPGNNRRKSKKKSLSDYNLYLREVSSQSEDNVDTESLFSLKDDSFSRLDDTSSTDQLFQPQASDKINETDVVARSELSELKREQHFVSDNTKENDMQTQVFSEFQQQKTHLIKTTNNKQKKKKKEEKQEEEEDKKFSNYSSVINDTFIEGKQKEPLLVLSDKEKNYEQVDDADKSNANEVEFNNVNASVDQQHKRNSFKRKKRKRTITRSMNDEMNYDEEGESSETMIFSSHQIRADQFNKVCPSPFENVPGFHQTQSTKQQQNTTNYKSELTLSPKLSKSCSFDSDASNKPLTPVMVGREQWILFEEEKSILNQQHENTTEILRRNSKVTVEECTTNTNAKEKKKLLDKNNFEDFEIKGDLQQSGMVAKSMENLLDVVNKTVSLLKGSLTNQTATNGDEDVLVYSTQTQNDDAMSELSDEIISLEFDTDEEKLRDTPVKQFPNVSLFQVSIVGTEREKLKFELNGKKKLESNNIMENGRNNILDEYPPVITRSSWRFWYRYPDKKKRFGSRKWIPVTVHLENEILKVNSLNGNSPEIKKEIPLHPFYNFTVPRLHKGNKDGRVHSIKLQYVKYKEKRRVKPRVGMEHVSIYTPVLKLSCRDVIMLREFISRIDGVIKYMPTHRDKGISYNHEEIFIDSDDQCSYLISTDGTILKYNTTVQLRLRCFVTGNPQLKLFLNDINNREILSRTKEALARESCNKLPSSWIAPELYEYNPCVHMNKSMEEGGVIFTPPDGCSFELLRFRLRKRNPLPIMAKSSLEVLSLNSVYLRAEVRVNGDAKNIRHKRNNVIFYIPVPSSWSKLFIKSRFAGRTSRYLSAKAPLKSNQPGRATNTRATFEVSAGVACYEAAYGAIIWELGTLPIIRDGLPADVTHTFCCSIELPFPLHIRDDFQPYSYLEYNIKQQMASNVSVEEILLSDGRVPEKWVCYRSNYMYRIEMKILEDGKERTKSE